jgi:hypothetical protein
MPALFDPSILQGNETSKSNSSAILRAQCQVSIAIAIIARFPADCSQALSLRDVMFSGRSMGNLRTRSMGKLCGITGKVSNLRESCKR